MSHRKPPLPDSMKRHPTVKGVCRWCDQPIASTNGKPSRSNWHPACVEAFKLIHWPAETRKSVFARDKGICARCGVDTERQQRTWRQTERLWYWLARRHFEDIDWRANNYSLAMKDVRLQMEEAGMRLRGSAWQHDHIRPLIEANGDIAFWQMDNIQTLCSECHVQKGREDNARRRAARQPQIQLL